MPSESMSTSPGKKRCHSEAMNTAIRTGYVDVKKLKPHEVQSILGGDMAHFLLSAAEFVRVQPDVCSKIAELARGDYKIGTTLAGYNRDTRSNFRSNYINAISSASSISSNGSSSNNSNSNNSNSTSTSSFISVPQIVSFIFLFGYFFFRGPILKCCYAVSHCCIVSFLLSR